METYDWIAVFAQVIVLACVLGITWINYKIYKYVKAMVELERILDARKSEQGTPPTPGGGS